MSLFWREVQLYGCSVCGAEGQARSDGGLPKGWRAYRFKKKNGLLVDGHVCKRCRKAGAVVQP